MGHGKKQKGVSPGLTSHCCSRKNISSVRSVDDDDDDDDDDDEVAIAAVADCIALPLERVRRGVVVVLLLLAVVVAGLLLILITASIAE